MPKVSIIIPVYNGERFLGQTISSALSQSWADKEIIVVDDGSIDGSVAIAKSFTGENVRLIQQPNSGASKARNTGLAAATGEWIQFLDADDYLRHDKIERQFAMLSHERQVAVCKTVHFFGNGAESVTDNDHFFQAYLDDPLRFLIRLYGGYDFRSGMIQPNAFLTSRKLLAAAGGWNEELTLDDDGEFFCRVILAADEIVYCNEAMNFYRKHVCGHSLSGSKSRKAYQSQFLSNKLKHEHLLNKSNDESLIPYIHTATFKAMQLLQHTVYPKHPDLLKEMYAFTNSLLKHSSRGHEVYGGWLANFIGNHVSWKLLKRLQQLRAAMLRKFSLQQQIAEKKNVQTF